MNGLTILIIFVLLSSSSLNAQESDFRGADTSKQIRIYSIRFTSSDSGWAESFFGDVLSTTDRGNTWQAINENQQEEYRTAIQTDVIDGWSADIFCAVMKSSDGGKSWRPYPKKQEEHFCIVYFKNENTGWQAAEIFLQGVIDTITTSMQKGDCKTKSGFIHKCREYYTDMDEGWTLGWCFKNLVSKQRK
jgi:hypothetical protein